MGLQLGQENNDIQIDFMPIKVLKILLVTFFCLSCTGSKTITNFSATLSEFYDASSNVVMVAAHRGAHHGNFENSIASTQKAIAIGVDIIEVDVRTTKDGQLVLMHDSTIDRTTTGRGKVENLTLAEIKNHKLKGPYGKISTESAPTFEEFLSVVDGRVMVDVDMKTDNVEGILAAVEKQGVSKGVFYFDNDYDQLDLIKRINASAQIMPRAYSLQMADSAVVRFSPPAVHIDPGFYTGELTTMLRENNARIWINALGEADCNIRRGNGEKVVSELLKYGANMIQTDEPELLLQLLRYKGLHK